LQKNYSNTIIAKKIFCSLNRKFQSTRKMIAVWIKITELNEVYLTDILNIKKQQLFWTYLPVYIVYRGVVIGWYYRNRNRVPMGELYLVFFCVCYYGNTYATVIPQNITLVFRITVKYSSFNSVMNTLNNVSLADNFLLCSFFSSIQNVSGIFFCDIYTDEYFFLCFGHTKKTFGHIFAIGFFSVIQYFLY